MATDSISSEYCTVNIKSDATWRELYPSLRSLAQHLVFSFRVLAWQGQEIDIAEDIVQETTRRLIERTRQGECGEAAPVHSLEHMMKVIACNYVKDLRRRDRRLIRMQLTSDGGVLEGRVGMGDQVDSSEVATERVYQAWLYYIITHEIANFPEKQRKALLIDLANRMSFDTHPTLLQMAFLEAGINIQEYQQPLPDNRVARSRHAALLHHAYRRIATIPFLQENIIAM